ncbi:hypothetical protein DL95DRAFT_188900 [Leptodontidium sp. 2 PMI_412]|nr:hypothetical protein DL95DRAFT_188900 [Leptodontidium sp. 2 PMI_412]
MTTNPPPIISPKAKNKRGMTTKHASQRPPPSSFISSKAHSAPHPSHLQPKPPLTHSPSQLITPPFPLSYPSTNPNPHHPSIKTPKQQVSPGFPP